MFSRKKIKFEEYFVNDTYLKKLYNLYIRESQFEKALNYLVFLAIIFSVMALVLELFMHLNEKVLEFIHTASTIVLIIFIIELIVEYSKSRTKKKFLKKFWIDLILVILLSFYFLFAPYLGLAKLEEVSKLKDFTFKLKHANVSVKEIKNKVNRKDKKRE